MPVPVILVAIADYRTDDALHLRELGAELDGIREALRRAEEAGLCRVITLADATVDKIVDAFNRYPVVVFHYAGHADGYRLLLKESLYADGLGPFLGKQAHLKLAFLNGCSTQPQVRELQENGVPLVIATSRSINDGVARDLAVQFYRALGEGKNLRVAFQQYTHRQEMKHSDFRALYHRSRQNDLLDDFPWALSIRPGSESVQDWSLPAEAGNPLFGLPPIPPRYDLPEQPFRYLHWFERKHAEVFFGREEEIRLLYEQLTDPLTPPLTLLYGQSGVGKSSLLHAGLFPRLEAAYQVHYLRRDPSTGLLGTVLSHLQGTDLSSAWHAAERQGQPVILILDQVEEAFTRPLPGTSPAQELSVLVEAVRQCMGNPMERPLGKLVLSYRKEYHPEVDEAFRLAELARKRLFLEPLKRRGLISAIRGLTRQARTHSYYRLEIEEELPERIADDLSEDPESPLAPMLQILLTRLWEAAIRENEHAPRFSAERYQQLKREGLLLNDFVQRQLEEVAAWHPELTESGLVLDLLFQFTTFTGTARRRERSELEAAYQDQKTFSGLLQQLQEAFLLVATGPDSYSLAHDTLAPLIRQRYELSERPGQRADRLLRSKLTLGEQATVLNPTELDMVEAGKSGRRVFSESELALLDRSRQHWNAVRREERARTLVLEAMRTVEKDPSASFEQAMSAWKLRPGAAALEALHQAYYEQVFTYADHTFATPPYRELGQHQDYVDFTAFSPDGTRIVSTSKDETVCIWSLQGALQARFNPGIGRVYSARFSPDGSLLVMAGEVPSPRIFTLAPEPLEKVRLEGHGEKVKYAEFSPDGNRLLTASWDGSARIWDREGHLLQTLEEAGDRVNFARFSTGGAAVFTASNDKKVRYYSFQDGVGKYVLHEWAFDHEDLVMCVDAWIETGQEEPILHLLTACWDGKGRYLRHDLKSGKTGITLLEGHTDRVHYCTFSPDRQYLLTTSWDATLRLWDLKGKELLVLRGHSEGIFSADFTPDGRYLVSGSSDKRMLLWDLRARPIAEQQGMPAVPRRERFSTQSLPQLTRVFPDGSGKAVFAQREVLLYDATGKEAGQIPAPTGGGMMPYLDLSEDGHYLLMPDGMRRCKVTDRMGQFICYFQEEDEELVSACFSEGGTVVESTSSSGKIRRWPFLPAAMEE